MKDPRTSLGSHQARRSSSTVGGSSNVRLNGSPLEIQSQGLSMLRHLSDHTVDTIRRPGYWSSPGQQGHSLPIQQRSMVSLQALDNEQRVTLDDKVSVCDEADQLIFISSHGNLHKPLQAVASNLLDTASKGGSTKVVVDGTEIPNTPTQHSSQFNASGSPVTAYFESVISTQLEHSSNLTDPPPSSEMIASTMRCLNCQKQCILAGQASRPIMW